MAFIKNQLSGNENNSIVSGVGQRVILEGGKKWIRCLLAPDESPGEGYSSLSISDDGGMTWETSRIDEKTGICYSTIFEVEPNVLFCQVDSWCWRIILKPQPDRK